MSSKLEASGHGLTACLLEAECGGGSETTAARDTDIVPAAEAVTICPDITRNTAATSSMLRIEECHVRSRSERDALGEKRRFLPGMQAQFRRSYRHKG